MGFLVMVCSMMFLKPLRSTALLGLSLACAGFFAPLIAYAGVFSVSPVRIFMQPRDRATAITITNDGDKEVVLQADMYEWKQKADGSDDLQLTEDMIVSPPIIKLAPGARQVVRLALLKPADASKQLTYRLITREIPEALSAKDKNLSISIALALSMPVFITPPAAKQALACSSAGNTANVLKVECTNSGSAHTQIRQATLLRGTQQIGKLDNAGYFLPGTKRQFDIPLAPGAAGAAELSLDLDDGSTPRFSFSLQ
jgi:fimbrial chaperone protein